MDKQRARTFLREGATGRRRIGHDNMKARETPNVNKSPDMIRVPGQLLPTENGHPVLPVEVGPQLAFRYDSKARTLEIDIPHWAIEGIEKVGILRLHFLPEAVYGLAVAVHTLEKKGDGTIGREPKIRAH